MIWVKDPPSGSALLFGNRGLTRRQARHRHAERRARHVVQADGMAEEDRWCITTVLPADAQLEIAPSGASLHTSSLNQLADPGRVKRSKWVHWQDALGQVVGQERSNVITAVTEGHLREVVGTEGKVSTLGDFVGRQRRSRSWCRSRCRAYRNFLAFLVAAMTPSARSRSMANSFLVPTNGIMISGLALIFFLAHAMAASTIACTCISRISG